MVLVVVAVTTPLATLATHYLLVTHLFQNVVLAEWAPALAVGGLPRAMAGGVRPRPTGSKTVSCGGGRRPSPWWGSPVRWRRGSADDGRSPSSRSRSSPCP